MKMGKVSVKAILFVMMTTSFFGTGGAFASHEVTMNEHARDQAEAEDLLTFRIDEVVERQSPSRCAADPKMVSDERLLDPQLPASDAMKSLVLLNPIECMKTKDIVEDR